MLACRFDEHRDNHEKHATRVPHDLGEEDCHGDQLLFYEQE